jgi:glycosyltransferase involved in cell wall biosynthesis
MPGCDEPLISIVITNYNYEAFLPHAIDSAVGQSLRAVEVIVVDDASTDGSRRVIAAYGDRVNALFLPCNGGNGAAFAAGLSASRGRIVLFLDSDDALYPNAAEEVAAAWSDGTAKVQFYLDVVDAGGRALGFRIPNIPFVDDVEAMLFHYGYYPSAPTSGNAYARRVLENILPVRPGTWRMGIDGLLNAMAALQGRVVSLDRSLGIYRHHSRNHSEASGVTLAKIRRDLTNESNREAAILAEIERRLGRRLDRSLSLRIPGHCKRRLLSLRLDPANHPYPDDRPWRLARSGIAASWQFPHHRFGKRLAATLGFSLLPLLPASWIELWLDPIVVSRRRKELLRRLTKLSGDGITRPA